MRTNLHAKVMGSLANGQAFNATVGGERIYQGTLTSLLSAASFSTPVIVLDEARFLPHKLGADQVRIALGYPGRTAFEGKDWRRDPRIEASLKASGKLAKANAAPARAGL